MPFPKDSFAEETRRKMREAAKKRIADPEIHKKIREANIGKEQSLEPIAKRVQKLMGQKRPTRSEETLMKLGLHHVWSKTTNYFDISGIFSYVNVSVCRFN